MNFNIIEKKYPLGVTGLFRLKKNSANAYPHTCRYAFVYLHKLPESVFNQALRGRTPPPHAPRPAPRRLRGKHEIVMGVVVTPVVGGLFGLVCHFKGLLASEFNKPGMLGGRF